MITFLQRQRRVAAPCNLGGGSPSPHRDKQRLTGAIFTVRGNRLDVRFPVRIRRIETRHLGGLAGVDRSSPENCTKVNRTVNSPRRCRYFSTLTRQRRAAAPCNLGGGSPSPHRDKQRLTGAIFTVRGERLGVRFPVRIRRIETTHLGGLAGVDRSSPENCTKGKTANSPRRCRPFPPSAGTDV